MPDQGQVSGGDFKGTEWSVIQSWTLVSGVGNSKVSHSYSGSEINPKTIITGMLVWPAFFFNQAY